MKNFFLFTVLFFLLSGSARKKPFITYYTVTFPASSSRLLKDTTYYCSHVNDGCQGPRPGFSPSNVNQGLLYPDTIYLVRSGFVQNDTIWRSGGMWYLNGENIFPEGDFRLHCAVRQDFIFPIDVPITIHKLPLDTNRTLKLQLGNKEISKTYEIKADRKLNKKQLALLKKRMNESFLEDYKFDYKKSDERFFRDQDLVDKKVMIRRIK